jgi:hypothetical protein
VQPTAARNIKVTSASPLIQKSWNSPATMTAQKNFGIKGENHEKARVIERNPLLRLSCNQAIRLCVRRHAFACNGWVAAVRRLQ